MLERLVQRNGFWWGVAYTISKNKMIADDLVQEMYLKLHDTDKEITDYYVIATIKNIYNTNYRQDKKLSSIDNVNVLIEPKYGLSDEEKEFVNSLEWWEKEIVEMTYDKSCRAVSRELNLNYQFVVRLVNKCKNKWQEEEKQKQKDLATR
jgi:DNA-directed RNA polymerase specialized sigma24 family protein